MYIDGFLIPVPTAKRDEYRDHEAKWWPLFRDLGAQTLVVGWGDDVPPGTQTDFRRAVDLRPDETVVFCWMTWPDKATRTAAFAGLEEKMAEMGPVEMPFDGRRMVMGGFETLLDEG